MKRILLYGFFGIENAGNEAMLRAFTEPIRESLGTNCEFVVTSRHPDPEYDKRYGVRTIAGFEYPSRELAAGRWLRGLNPDDSGKYMEFVREVADSDLVVLGPGQYLVETGASGMLKGALGQALALAGACAITHTPLYGLALACEDLESTWASLLIQRLLPGFAALTFRDPASVANLRAAGIEVPPHEVLGDLALLGRSAALDQAEAMFRAEGIPPRSGPRLAVALRNIYWLGIDREAHRKKMADVVARWLADPSRDVLLIPQNVYDVDGDRDDDRVEAERTIAFLPPELQSRVRFIRGKHDPASTEAAYGTCDVSLSTRLHGAVFSCKQGTPPVMLSFMDKSRGFFARLGHPDCLVEFHTDSIEIAGRLEATLQERETRSASVLRSVSDVRRTAGRYVDIALGLLEAEMPERKRWAISRFC